jgi:hypothetical protein
MLPQLDPSRQAATDADALPSHHHTLTIDDAVLNYQDAGLPRTPRTLQRKAEVGHLNAEKILTATGAKYLITPPVAEPSAGRLRLPAPGSATGRARTTGGKIARRYGVKVPRRLTRPRNHFCYNSITIQN